MQRITVEFIIDYCCRFINVFQVQNVSYNRLLRNSYHTVISEIVNWLFTRKCLANILFIYSRI